MKAICSIILLIFSLSLRAQVDHSKTVLSAPDGWRPEIINFPLGFAPELDYSGFEDIRFSKGWADTTATDYFTYTFTWVLDQNPKLDKNKLEFQMKAYFDGLMAAVSERNDLPKTEATFNIARAKRDFGASGKIRFYEAFFKKEVIELNGLVSGKQCKAEGKYLVRFELSPAEAGDEVWSSFKEVKLTLDCN